MIIKELLFRLKINFTCTSRPAWVTPNVGLRSDMRKVSYHKSFGFNAPRNKCKYFCILGCKAQINTLNGTISSPAFGLNNYPSNQECLFKIKNPNGGALSLNFNKFDVDKSDYIQVGFIRY